MTPSTTAKPEAGDRCPTRLLEDSPALEDRFGGAHRRLAEALSELAATEPGGRTVALEGGWGSGKSTVVQLLKSIFTSSSRAVVVFDAWAHQGDPLRRAFLETVIAELRTESRAWLDETRWGEKLEALAKRRRVETQRTRPRIEWLGRVLLALLLLVPLGGVLLNRGLQEDDGHLIALGVVLALGPLVAVLCAAAIALIRGRSFDFDSLLALVIRHIDSEVNRESIETPDPTSIEFEANFHDIVSEALAAPDRRLVIVLDNLDRVDPQSARDIVATLQVFVGSEEHALPGFERLWLLIPYDRIGLASVWSATAVDRGAEGDTFLDKLFAARFSTPPMAISAWHEYLRELLGEALPRHVTADFDMIIQLFARRQAIATSHGQGPADANAGRLVEAPTPRELKLFVNQIGVLHRQWDDDFELETLAYFVLLHRYGLDLASGLRSGTLPQEALVPVLPADARRQLAALHYGDSPERAEQLLYEEPLEAALAAGDGQAVRELSSAHGFFAVLESRSWPEWSIEDSSRLASAVLALESSGLFDTHPMEMSRVRSLVRNAAEHVHSWGRLDPRIGTGIASAIRVTASDEVASAVLESLDASATGVEDLDEPEARTWVQGLVAATEPLSSLSTEVRFTVPCSAAAFVLAASEAAERDQDGHLWGALEPRNSPEEIGGALRSAFLGDDKGALESASASTVLIRRPTRVEWTSLIDAILDWFRQATPEPGVRLTAAVTMLRELGTEESRAREGLVQLANDGVLYHHLHVSLGASDWKAAAIVLYHQLDSNASESGPPVIGESAAGLERASELLHGGGSDDAVREFSELLVKLNDVDLEFRLLQARPDSEPFVHNILRVLGQRDDFSSLIGVEGLFARWGLLSSALPVEDLDRLVGQMIVGGTLHSHLQHEPLDTTTAAIATVALRSQEGAGDAGLASWVVERLHGLSAEVWEGALSEGNSITELLLSAVEGGLELNMEGALEEALEKHASAIAQGSLRVEVIADRWPRIIEAFSPTGRWSRSHVEDRILAVARSHSSGLPDHFFDLYGEWVGAAAGRTQSADVFDAVLLPILRTRSVRALQWLSALDLTATGARSTKKVAEARGRFGDEVARLLSEDPQGDGELATLTRNLAESLGISADQLGSGLEPEGPESAEVPESNDGE